MSTPFQPHKAGLAVGGALGLFHLAWSLLVASGSAQAVLDLVFRLHMIRPAYTVMTFDPKMALGLIIVTSVMGYVSGWVLATIWNYTQKK